MVSRFVLTLLLVLASAASSAQDRKFIVAAPQAGLLFSNGVLVGDTLYISGTLGLDSQTGKPPSDADDEARLVMDAIKKTVESAGLTMADVVMLQIHCPDLSLYAAFNKVYRTYFQADLPARAFIGSGKLLRDARFEVLGIAIKRK
jgi:2-iminobutanoate/2-iminopropanoate deaminase